MRQLTRTKIAQGLDERQLKFIEVYIATGDEIAARDAAGYSEKSHPSILMAGNAMARAVGLAVRHELGVGAPVALKVLRRLATGAQSERVQADCAKTLLDRAGHISPKAREDKSANETPLHEMSTDELRAVAARLEEDLSLAAGIIAGRAKDVSSATVAPLEPQAIDLVG